MPTEDWLKNNPKVSAHIPVKLYQQLEEFMEQRGITSNAEAVKQILNEYLSSKVDHTTNESSPLSSQPVDHSVDQRLTTLEKQVNTLSQQVIDLAKSEQKHQSSPQVVHRVDHPNQESSQLVDYSSPLPKAEGWLTTGEAFAEAQRRGYTKSKRSFKRELSSEAISEDLRSLGLVANWEVRQQANPKDNSVRWLKFED